jgi:glycolate oxidase iron-sulfur subunit
MQTELAEFIKYTPEGREAEAILRKCVHCGFCNATCPTYQLLGDELDGPRGRIYLIKQMLEGEEVTAKTRLHLDRCLTCRNCESTCPSGVEYGKLVDIGRHVAEARVLEPRGDRERALRWLLKAGLTSPLFAIAIKLGQRVRGLLPAALKAKVPAARPRGGWPSAGHVRRMLALAGCAQPAMGPNINPAAARVLDLLGIQLIEAPAAGCCGAVRFHLDDHDGGRADARRNVDAWWHYVEQGIEALVMTASGCGVFVREYAHLLHDDPNYAGKARRIAAMTFDLSEVVLREKERLLELLGTVRPDSAGKLAFHPPCTLQHGQKVCGVTEEILRAAGYALTSVENSHLCCGSAGSYSVLQAELAYQLRDNKLAALTAGAPQAIVSSNIGCLTHLQSGTDLPVRHWIEMLDRRLSGSA